jgi:hypothetical protein
VSFGNILSSRGSNPGMAHPLEFNTIHERSALFGLITQDTSKLEDAPSAGVQKRLGL